MRIISLLASGTEIVAALGLADALVGISHECDYPPAVLDRPRVSRPRFDPTGLDSAAVDRAVRQAMAEHGSVYEVDSALLERLRPDLILTGRTQAVCEVCAGPTPGVREQVRSLALKAEVLSLDAHTLGDILATIGAVGEAAGAAARARELRDGLAARLAELEHAVRDEPRPRVLALEWLAPPFAPGHWVPEMITLAGGECLVGARGSPSRQLDWGELGGLDPDVLVVMPCGYDVRAAGHDAAAHAARLSEVAPRAVAEGRAWVVDGSAYFNRSGPRVVQGVAILSGLLHPDVAAAPAADQARRWAPPG